MREEEGWGERKERIVRQRERERERERGREGERERVKTLDGYIISTCVCGIARWFEEGE